MHVIVGEAKCTLGRWQLVLPFRWPQNYALKDVLASSESPMKIVARNAGDERPSSGFPQAAMACFRREPMEGTEQPIFPCGSTAGTRAACLVPFSIVRSRHDGGGIAGQVMPPGIPGRKRSAITGVNNPSADGQKRHKLPKQLGVGGEGGRMEMGDCGAARGQSASGEPNMEMDNGVPSNPVQEAGQREDPVQNTAGATPPGNHEKTRGGRIGVAPIENPDDLQQVDSFLSTLNYGTH